MEGTGTLSFPGPYLFMEIYPLMMIKQLKMRMDWTKKIGCYGLSSFHKLALSGYI